MANYFDTFLQLSMTHGYFSNGKCQGLVVKAAKTSQEAMKKRGMICKANSAGFDLLCLKNESDEWKRMDGSYSFVFYLIPDNQYFKAISNLEIEWGDKEAAYLNNIDHLSDGNNYTYKDSQSERVILRKQKFEIRFDEAITESATVSLTDTSENEYQVTDRLGVPFENNELPIGTQFFKADLSNVPQGRFSLTVSGGNSMDETIFTIGNSDPSNILGVVEIFIKDTMTGSSSDAPFEYGLEFSSRETTWRFMMSEDIGNSIEPEKNNQTEFTQLTIDGKTVFQADTQLKLEEDYDYIFKLVKSDEFYKNLPFPTLQGLVPGDNNTIYSEIYVQA